MAVDMFLKIATIKGESKDKVHADTIDVLAWSWSVSNSSTTHLGSGGGAGKANFADISISKYVDKATPTIVQHVSRGIHIPKVHLIVRKAGDKPLEYVKIDMTDVLISSYSTGGHSGDDRLTENISLNFSEFKVVYTVQKQDGSGGAAPDFGYKIASNADA